jgi:hypothetical protein
MSNTESFIEEVSDEVRRDRLFALLKRYGWIAALAIIAIVGGTAWNEYQKSQTVQQAQDLGDAVLASLSEGEPAARAEGLSQITAESAGAQAVLGMLTAGAKSEAGDPVAASDALSAIAVNGDVPEIYRQIAAFKSLLAATSTMTIDNRRAQFEALAIAGNPLRLLASEQLALIEIEAGATEAALERFQAILLDAEATTGLQQRAAQSIVALGGVPEFREGSTNG